MLVRNWPLLTLMPGLALSASRLTEVDLVFPRANETHAPSSLTPIVFAIQNPSLLSSLRPILSYSIAQPDRFSDRTIVGDSVRLFERNLTHVTDPYMLYWSVDLVIEGTFEFAWQVSLDNCSHNSETDKTDMHLFGGQGTQFYFSTKNDASPPDLIAFAEEETCNQAFALAVHVPSTLQLPPTKTAELGGPSCAVNPDLALTPSPCNVKMDSSAAASISASLTSAACSNVLRTGVSCPTPTPEN
ncbi:hypothetical protein ATEIFO6365_0013035000 [Aspergillus terreus]|uniref:DUF7136 domain-containing protein n=1 Tax=Aspergillus terreus TaxID=33178 RepID=A0A5M3ZGM8_ASPTE|nr:hypothetical protein ATETN484_0014035000 [Aspergillus terreus]GFF21016.1 hypothetical protein ATEIFO6365_0013035000 [Aspergillus terreus]